MGINNKIPIPAWLLAVIIAFSGGAIAWAINSSVTAGKYEIMIESLQMIQEEEKIKVTLNTTTNASQNVAIAVMNEKLTRIDDNVEKIKRLLER